VSRANRHLASDGSGRVFEETDCHRIPFRGEWFVSSDGSVAIQADGILPLDHGGARGRVRHILREVRRPGRDWKSITLSLVPESRLTKAEGERDAALERVAELEAADAVYDLAVRVGRAMGRIEASGPFTWGAGFEDRLREFARGAGARLIEINLADGHWTYTLEGPRPGGHR
jgi:hypothetical protein